MYQTLKKSPHLKRITNMVLRLGTLGLKMVFTLYMGRYFSLSDLGIYGLVFGIVMVVGGIVGMRIDYVLSREIVGVPMAEVICKMRDQVIFYGTNYLLLAIVALLLQLSGFSPISHKIMLYVFIISVLEGYAGLTYANMNSLEQPIMANALFFLRSGFWTVPVIIAGLLYPSLRNFDVVFIAWILGVGSSLIATAYVWRKMPWQEMLQTPINWDWIKTSVKKCFLIWLGGLGIVGGYYVDRLIVVEFLGLDYAGIATFYLSFTNALLTIIQSGVLSIAYPRLIRFYRERKMELFHKEIKQTFFNANAFSLCIAVIMAVVVPLIGKYFHKPEIVREEATLWLMLVGMCIRSNTEVLYFILFARHQDKAIWLGNLLFLIPALLGNMLFVHLFGLAGIGYSAIFSAICLLTWRGWHVQKFGWY